MNLFTHNGNILRTNGMMWGAPNPGPQPGPTWDETTIGDNTWAAENLAYDDGGEGILIVPNVTVNGTLALSQSTINLY